ncbi:MAG: hypothetical protein WC119_00345 [Synergistaceae bacterium]
MKTEITILKVEKLTIEHPESWMKGELKQLAQQYCESNGSVSKRWDLTGINIERNCIIEKILE